MKTLTLIAVMALSFNVQATDFQAQSQQALQGGLQIGAAFQKARQYHSQRNIALQNQRLAQQRNELSKVLAQQQLRLQKLQLQLQLMLQLQQVKGIKKP